MSCCAYAHAVHIAIASLDATRGVRSVFQVTVSHCSSDGGRLHSPPDRGCRTGAGGVSGHVLLWTRGVLEAEDKAVVQRTEELRLAIRIRRKGRSAQHRITLSPASHHAQPKHRITSVKDECAA